MHQDADAVALLCGLVGDVAEGESLAATSGEHEEDGAVAGHEGAPDLVDSDLLVVAELNHRNLPGLPARSCYLLPFPRQVKTG